MAIAFNAQPIAVDRCVLNLDANNSKSYSNNTHSYPLDVGTWAVPAGAYQATLSRDTTVTDSPAGGVPLKMAVSAATPNSAYVGTYNSPTWNIAPALNGQTWTVSFWVKGSSAFTASMLIFEANSSGNYTTYGQPSYSVTTSWTRVSGTYTMSQATTAYIQVRFDNYNVSTNMWVDGLQVEKNASATPFNPRTNSGGSTWTDPVRQITATNYGYVPFSTDGGGCFDMTAATGAPSNLGFTFSVNMVPRVGNFAFSCWTKSTPAGPGQVCLFSNAGGAEGFRFGTSQTGAYVLCGNPYNEGSVSWTAWDNTTWHHVVAAYDRTGVDTGTPRIAVYLDGVYQGALGLSAPQIQMADVTPGLVRNPGNSWVGKLAIFAVYSGHLTAGEVNALFNSQRGRFGV
jgi:hypothetical protein